MRRCFDERGVFLSRYGGDEFVAVFPLETPEQLAPRIARFEAMLLETDGVDALDIPLTVSIGMAAMPDERVKAPADLIRLADESMYADKRS